MRRLVALLLIFGTLPGATVMAQSHDTVQEHVRSLDDQERLAALRRDTAALERLWSDEFVVNAPNNQVVVGRRAVLDTFVRAGVINFSTFERQIEFIQVDGPYVVIMGLARRGEIQVPAEECRLQISDWQIQAVSRQEIGARQ